ncbi:MAG: DoxX family protein [Planctomycetota bacterium]|nr:DoxX family protein [Planctomycetota bacterium]
MTPTTKIVSWVCQIAAAAIMGQTIFFKFTGAEEPVYIFTKLGAEPWGRYGTAVMELIAAILLLYPKTAAIGAVLGMGLMFGAIGSHLTKLGIVVKDDGGLLFALGIITFVASAVVLWIRRPELPIVGSMLATLGK